LQGKRPRINDGRIAENEEEAVSFPGLVVSIRVSSSAGYLRWGCQLQRKFFAMLRSNCIAPAV
jgi:hypothetical protein